VHQRICRCYKWSCGRRRCLLYGILLIFHVKICFQDFSKFGTWIW